MYMPSGEKATPIFKRPKAGICLVENSRQIPLGYIDLNADANVMLY
jgi:hypothetical protein